MVSLVNGAITTLGADITAAATTITVPTGKGAMFPSGDFTITLDDGTHQEIVYVPVGGRSGDTFSNCVRAYESYAGAQTAYTFTAATPTQVAQTATAATMNRCPIKFAEVVLTGTQASVTLPVSGALPQNYRHIKLQIEARSDAAGVNNVQLNCQFNGDTAAHYDWASVLGTGAASSTTGTGQTAAALGIIPAATATANSASTYTVSIIDYSGTTFYKVANSNGFWWTSANPQVRNYSSNWQSATAITSITLAPASGNFMAGSTFTLYLEP